MSVFFLEVMAKIGVETIKAQVMGANFKEDTVIVAIEVPAELVEEYKEEEINK